MENRSSGANLLYGLDDIPPVQVGWVLGLQHYLTMFGSTMAIPLILSEPLGIENPADLAALIATMFFVSGLTTILQTTWGNRLLIVQGGTFSFLAPNISVCSMAALEMPAGKCACSTCREQSSWVPSSRSRSDCRESQGGCGDASVPSP